MAKKVLITGASGFIGSTLCDLGLEKDHEIYAGIRQSSSRINLTKEKIRFKILDLEHPEILFSQLSAMEANGESPDWVIHNAGITRAHNRHDFFQVNEMGAANLAWAVQKLENPPEKFLLISSLATHGPGDPLSQTPIRVSDPQRPLSTYGQSKLAAEKRIKSLDGLPFIIVRPTAVYGPRDRDFLGYFQLVKNGWVPDIGRGEQILSFIFSRDLAEMVFRLLDKASPGTEFLLSDGQTYNKYAMSDLLGQILGKKIRRIPMPLGPLKAGIKIRESMMELFGRYPFLNSGKLAEISSSNWGCDSSPALMEFGLNPLRNLKEGLEETTRWYLDQGWLK
jgi:UDP-glucose 4-epimerase